MEGDKPLNLTDQYEQMTVPQRREAIELLELDMRAAAKNLNFEKAAEMRDIILELKSHFRL